VLSGDDDSFIYTQTHVAPHQLGCLPVTSSPTGTSLPGSDAPTQRARAEYAASRRVQVVRRGAPFKHRSLILTRGKPTALAPADLQFSSQPQCRSGGELQGSPPIPPAITLLPPVPVIRKVNGLMHFMLYCICSGRLQTAAPSVNSSPSTHT
jgi:hypothetical protein